MQSPLWVAGIEESPGNQLLRAGGLSHFFKKQSYCGFLKYTEAKKVDRGVQSTEKEFVRICTRLSSSPHERASGYISPGESVCFLEL